jgi:kumamolisin
MRTSVGARSRRIGGTSVRHSWISSFRFRHIVLSAVIVAGSATAIPASATASTPNAALSLPSLSVAEHVASDLGPVPASTPITFSLTLRERHSSALQALLAGGGTTSAAQWASTYGPDPALVARTRRALSRAGLSSTWRTGQSLLSATGGAGAIDHLLHLTLQQFVLDGSTHFYAALTSPDLPKSMAHFVTAVTGLDDYPSHLVAAIPHAGTGVSPSEFSKFYDLTPLRAAGFNGAGMTVMFPEAVLPPMASLRAYAAKFHLPPFHVSVRINPRRWGGPVPSSQSFYEDLAGEEALDLEVVHGLAPGAREIVYEWTKDSSFPDLIQTMIADNPGAILSSSFSMVNCEGSAGGRDDALAQNAVFAHAAALGRTIFFASGDRGAYACLPDGEPTTEGTLSVDPDVDSPDITGVGGTSAFFASNGAYFKESAWGEPLETWGTGGGISTIFRQPSYQVAPGLGAKDLGGRGVPDVACNADPVTSGWAIFSPINGKTEQYPSGGTSAAAPCWAAVTAIIDEYLTKQRLAKVGFANPALYYFARDPSGLPASPFHQVTEGTNLHFVATPGWNAATGLGTPDAAHLAADFEWYDRNRPSKTK